MCFRLKHCANNKKSSASRLPRKEARTWQRKATTLTEDVRSGTFFEKQRRKQQKECKSPGRRRHERGDEKQLHSMKMSVWTHFFEKQRRKQQKKHKPSGERQNGRADGRQRRGEHKPRAGDCDYTSSAFLKNTALAMYRKDAKTREKCNGAAGLRQKSTLIRNIAVYHIESRAFHVKQRKNKRALHFWAHGTKRLPCATRILPRRSALSTICQHIQSPFAGTF